jgi:hypothetical protein
MEQFSIVSLSLVCLGIPLAILFLITITYCLGIGALKLPGISRGEEPSGKDWSAVPEAVQKINESVAAVIGLLGGILGFFGFLLPWAKLEISIGGLFSEIVGSLNGTMTGIALAFQLPAGAIMLVSSEKSGAIGIGILLLLVSIFIWILALALFCTTAMSIGVIAVPLGLSKGNLKRIARALMLLGTTSLCLSLTFLAGMQATVNGIQLGANGVGISVEVASGFWIALGGMFVAVVGAWIAYILADRLSTWVTNLSRL